MFGIPFTIRRQSDRGVEEETLYLRTHRTGKAGAAMRAAMRDFQAAAFEQRRCAYRVGLLAAKAGAVFGDDKTPAPASASERMDLLDRFDRDQEELTRKAQALSGDALEHAERIAALALVDNYSVERVAEIMDGLTDRDLRAIVETLEMGQMPKDFFPSPGTPPTPNSTGPSGGAPAAPSSPADSPGATSSAAK